MKGGKMWYNNKDFWWFEECCEIKNAPFQFSAESFYETGESRKTAAAHLAQARNQGIETLP